MWKLAIYLGVILLTLYKCNTEQMNLYTKDELNQYNVFSIQDAEEKKSAGDKILSLNIKDYKESSLPTSIFSYEELQKLTVFYSMVTEIPVDISKLSQLQFLHIASCPLVKINPTIGDCNHLKEIAIGNCELTEIPLEIGNCKQLTSINFEANKIKSLPDEINQLQNLETLILDDNYLASIPSFSGLSNLLELGLATNEITSFQDDAFEGLDKLIKLKLDFNPFEELPVSITKLNHLESLHIQGSAIRSFPAGMENLQSLKVLHIRGAKDLSEDVLKDLQQKLPKLVIHQ